LALQGSYGFKEQAFTVVASVIPQDILHGAWVAEEIDRMGQDGQPYDVAKLRAECPIFSQRVTPQTA
jgi:hypothetical protein